MGRPEKRNETNQFWRDAKGDARQERAERAIHYREELRELQVRGLLAYTPLDEHGVRVRTPAGKVADYWPGTGSWTTVPQGKARGHGWRSLLEYLRIQA